MHRKRHRCFCPVRQVLQQENQPGTRRKPVLPRFAKIKKVYSYYVYPYGYFIVLWRSMCVKRVRILVFSDYPRSEFSSDLDNRTYPELKFSPALDKKSRKPYPNRRFFTILDKHSRKSLSRIEEIISFG